MRSESRYTLIAMALIVAGVAAIGIPASKRTPAGPALPPGLGESSECPQQCAVGMDEHQEICGGECKNVKVECVSDTEYRERFGEGTGHATPGECTIYFRNSDCERLGIPAGSDLIPIEELRRKLTQNPNPGSAGQIHLLCSAAHELGHIITGCNMPHCFFEWFGFEDQIACLRGYYQELCSDPAHLPPSECQTISYYMCAFGVAQQFQGCRCNTGGILQHDTCPGCYQNCVTGITTCGGSAAGAAAWCAHLDRIYCDGHGVVTPTPTPDPQDPPPGGCLPPEFEFDAHTQSCVPVLSNAAGAGL